MDCFCMERPKEAGGRGLAKNLLGMTSFDVASHDFETDPGEALRQKCVDMTTKLWLECEKMIASLGDAPYICGDAPGLADVMFVTMANFAKNGARAVVLLPRADWSPYDPVRVVNADP